jgi:hypothetical protein
MWITPQDEAWKPKAALPSLLCLFSFVLKRSQLWFSFLCLAATALLVTAIVAADLGTQRLTRHGDH